MSGARWPLILQATVLAAAGRAAEPTASEILLVAAEERAGVAGGPAVPPPPPPEERDDDRAPQFRIWGYPDRPVRGQRAALGFFRQEFYTPVPIILDDTDILAATVRV